MLKFGLPSCDVQYIQRKNITAYISKLLMLFNNIKVIKTTADEWSRWLPCCQANFPHSALKFWHTLIHSWFVMKTPSSTCPGSAQSLWV